MALAELRDRIGRLFEQMRETFTMDETTLNSCLNEITCALLDADLPSSLVKELESRSQKIINLPPACNKGCLIYQNMLAELFSQLDPGKSALVQAENRETTIVMFIGLQGVEKTEMCAKYSRYHQKKGFKPALVRDDTFKDEKIIAKLKKEKHDLIIVDTSSDRHTEYSLLFKEMRRLAEEIVKPDLVIYVMDSSIGHVAAFDQAQAFKQSFSGGSVLLTNVNTAPKPLGAISAVAAAKCPMILEAAQTGAKSDKEEEFEAFEAKAFVRRLFRNPWVSPNYQPGYTLRRMYTYCRNDLGLDNEISYRVVPASCRKKLNLEKLRRYVTILGSMTDEELDKSNIKNMERVMEIAEAAKVDVKEVVDMLISYKKTAKAIKELEQRLLKNPIKPYKLRSPDVLGGH